MIGGDACNPALTRNVHRRLVQGDKLQAVPRAATSLPEELFRQGMQERIRHLHERLPKEIGP